MKNTDFEILSGIRNGSTESFNLLFESYYAKLCRYVACILHDHDAAEDIIQDLFANIWVDRNKFSIKSSLGAYLFRSAYHASLDYLKHLKVKDQYQGKISFQEPETFQDWIVIDEMLEKMGESIEQLPEQCKIIFKLSRFEDLKYKEIAAKLQLSENTVDTQIRRALKKLKEDLKDYLVTLIAILSLFF